MMTSKFALGLTMAGALACGLIGCGDGSSGATASAEASGKTAAASAHGSAAPKGSAATAETAKPAEGGGATAASNILKTMPKDCDEGRVYANVGKILTGDSGAALDALVVKAMAMGKDAKKGDAVLKVLKDGGIDPVKGLKEMAVCMTKDDTKMIVAVTMDMSKAEKPADVFAKAMETGEGKAPKKEEVGDATYLTSEDGKDILAIVGKDTIIVGKTRAAVEASVKGGGGEGDFADSASKVVWAKVVKDNTLVDMKETGDNFDLKISMDDKQAAKKKEQAEKMIPTLDGEIGKLPPDIQKLVTPLLPIAKNAKFDVQGETLAVTTSFPKAALGEFLTAAGQAKPEELMKGLKF